jgi:1-acyl-sn-glycerol-3-phosphate acyltransferase
MVGAIVTGGNRVNFMAKEELFNIFILGTLLKKLGAFPVKRNTADKSAIRRALQVLEEGGILGLFPEGTRSRTGELGKPRHGAALIALKSKKPVLPVAIKWPEKIFRPVEVKIGPLIYFAEEGKIRGNVLEEASLQIMEEIKKLL